MTWTSLYTDGAIKGIGKKEAKGGWAFVVVKDNNEIDFKFDGKDGAIAKYPVTNSTMEFYAMAQALIYIKEKLSGQKVAIYCDSEYVINSLLEWVPKWKKNGWRSYRGSAVKNVELIKFVYNKFVQLRDNVRIYHVKGHSGNKFNDRADELAKKGVLKLL